MLHFAFLLLAAAQEAPVASWSFDKEVRDGGPSAFPTKVYGKLEFVDSPVGFSGRAAVLNAVDTYLEVTPPGKLGVGAADFTLSFWLLVLDKRPVTLFSRKVWGVSLQDKGALKFSSDLGSLATGAGACPSGEWCHVVVCRGAQSRILVNGNLAASGEIKPGDLDASQEPLLIGKGPDEARPFGGLLDNIELYGRALSDSDVVKLTGNGLPWLPAKAIAKTPFAGKFELLSEDVVAFTGAEDARVAQELGYLETLLSFRVTRSHLYFRNMTWEGDTVYEQYRPLNFGSWTDQFRRAGVSVVFAQFGQIESLEGRAGVDRFSAAYEALLAQFAATTKRIVLVTPAPFGKSGPQSPDLTKRNDDLKLYVEAIRKIAQKNSYLLVDLSTPAMAAEGLSRDGLHLSTAGQWMAAKETARQLEIPGLSDLEAPNERGAFRKEELENVRSAIRYKNGLWTDYWRPANWAFLNGDRVDQPSSRDHVDRRVRWFPVEVQQLPVLVQQEEGKIELLMLKAGKK